MSPKLARQLVVDAKFEAIEDLLAPAIAVRPRLLYASEPRRKRGRWLDWLLRTPTDGPVIESVPVLDELTLPIGTSRFDSVPDVPIGFEWPCHSTGALLECVAQIDLSATRAASSATSLALPGTTVRPSLPEAGWLLFFVGEGDSLVGEFESRVIYVEPQPLTRWSTQVPRSYTRQTCRLDFEPIYSLPDAHDWCVEQRITFVNAHIERYVALQEKLTNSARHYLLGYPRAIQGDVRADAVHGYAEASGTTLNWHQCAEIGNTYALLLQLDSDADGPGWMWGDAGSLYFVLRQDDLIARRFDKTRVVMQCC